MRDSPCTLSVLILSLAASPAVAESSNIAPNPSFELDAKRLGGWIPVGPLREDGSHGIAIVESTARSGKRSLRVTPGPTGTVTGKIWFSDYNGGEGERRHTSAGGVRGARTVALRLERDTAAVEASVWVHHPQGTGVELAAAWTSRLGRRRPVVHGQRNIMRDPVREESGWRLYRLRAIRPPGTCQVQLIVETDATEPIHIDDVELRFVLRERRDLLVDQLGYETGSRTKRAVLQSTRSLERVSPARVVDLASGETVLEVQWAPRGRLDAWDVWHWVADFSELRTPGRYAIALDSGDDETRSPPFAVLEATFSPEIAKLAHQFYLWQRCGTEVPGVHAACHLDDARSEDGTTRDLTGGWHDAGDYNKYCGLTPEAARALAFAAWQKAELFAPTDADGNGLSDIVDEALWGVRFLRKMLDEETLELLNAVSSGYRYWGPPERETDNRPGTGDERPVTPGRGDATHCVPAFALVGKWLIATGESARVKEGRELVELAERLHTKVGARIDHLLALHEATGKAEYHERARALAEQLLASQPESGVSGFRELALWAISFPQDPLSARIRAIAVLRAAELQTLCDNPFGVAMRPDGSSLVYCRQYEDVNDWYVGETSTRLDVAIDGALCGRLGVREGRDVAEDQVHWILGRNPLGLSMLEGVGTHFVPQYHHRYNAIEGLPRGAVPGALINGFVRAWPHIDRPWLDPCSVPNGDYHANEPWLLHNNRWLALIAYW